MSSESTDGGKIIQGENQENHSFPHEPQGSAACSECGILFVAKGGVQNSLQDAQEGVVCPACTRIANRYPAGYVEAKGAFLKKLLDEVLQLIRETAVQASKKYPMERIMEVVHDDEGIIITTTGIIIARKIGEALSRAYKGNLRMQSADDEEFIRVFWEP